MILFHIFYFNFGEFKNKHLLIFFPYYFLFLGFSLCSYVLYIRVILKSMPKYIGLEWNFGAFLAFSFLTYLYYKLLKYKLKKNKKPINLKSYKVKILLKLVDYYDKCLYAVYAHFAYAQTIINGKELLQQLVNIVYKVFRFLNFTRLYQYYYLYVFLVILPRLIITILFFIEVVCYNYMYYTYAFIWLLIIPLIWRIIYYLIKEYTPIQSAYLELYFDIEIITDPIIIKEKYKSPKKKILVLTANYEADILEYFPIHMDDYPKFSDNIEAFNFIKKFYLAPYSDDSNIFKLKSYRRLTLIIYILSFITWGYLLVNMGLIYTHMYC